MVDSISSSTQASAAASAAAASSQSASLTNALTGNQSLGQDDFLKLLVAQLQHQDPLQPQDDSAFVAQLAQFSSLSQTMGINTRLDLLSSENQGLQNSSIIGMVGKQATVKGSQVTSDGAGSGVPVNFTLAGDSDKTQLVIQDQNGNTVRTMDLGQKNAGLQRINWDGRNNSGVLQPAGTYQVTVQAQNSAGGAVDVSQETTGTIQSVSFDKGYPVLNLDTGVSVPVADLVQVNSPPNTSK